MNRHVKVTRFTQIILTITFVISGCTSFHSESGAGSSGASPTSIDSGAVQLITADLLLREKTLRDQASTSNISELVAKAEPYSIESGDMLSIIVWDHPEFGGAAVQGVSASTGLENRSPGNSAQFVVDHNGLIQFPFVGQLKLAGLTEEGARNLLATRLAHYVNKPNVTLNIQSYRSKRIYVDGEVKVPGVLPITDIPMTLVEAINRAGGFLPAADQSQIALSRGNINHRINIPEMVQRGINPADVMLKHGDIIRVRSREESKVFVSGEVIGPRSLAMHNGRLSLSEALGESGGINPISGDSRQVYVVRRAGTVPLVFRLDAYNSSALAMAEGFELEPKDIIYVAATPLTNWQRTISQLLPSAFSSAVSTVVPPR